MRILLCSPPLENIATIGEPDHIRICPHLGLYLLTAVLEECGHQVRLVDPVDFESAFGSTESITASVSDIDVIGVSVNSCTWQKARELLLALDALDSRPVTVLGGPHASILDEHILRTAPVDYAVRGEGERSFPMLIDSLSRGRDMSKIPGISYLKDEQLVRNPPGPLLSEEELAELPLPRFELMPDGYYDLIPVESSRGCYHACIFCSIIYRRNWRGISPEALASRLSRQEHLLPRTRHQSFFIVDDCFTADHDRMRRIADELSGLQHQLIFEARITDLIAKGMMDTITSLPVRVIEMGVECGYDEGLARVGKKLTLAQVAEAAEIIKQHDLGDRSRFCFIIGLPWETKKEVFKTLEYAFKLTGRLGARLVASWLTLYPGSIIWRKRQEWGIDINEADYDNYKWWRAKDVFIRSHPGLDAEKDMEEIFAYAQMLMKLFPNIIHDGFFRYIPLD